MLCPHWEQTAGYKQTTVYTLVQPARRGMRRCDVLLSSHGKGKRVVQI